MHERDLFIAAFEIEDESARRAYLDSACAGDLALRVRVERLLSREVQAGDFLEQPAADLCADVDEKLLTQPGEPELAGGERPTMLGKADDTGQTVIVNLEHAAPSASNSNAESVSQSGVTKVAATLGTLFGRYRVERVLGSGGMGVVYLAEDLRLGRRVALKIPKFDVDTDGRFHLIERFRREARTMASVLHRNLCPIFDVDEQDGTHYLTMAFIEGETLAQAIKRERAAGRGSRETSEKAVARSGSRETSDRTLTSSATRIAELIRKLALALDEAHRAGIVHRDLKPSNVMIDRSGEPILMDFGLAWMAHEADARVTQSGAIVGTPAYMSPEQAEGDSDKVGAASDLYSLGAILYELLAGQPIHTGGVTRVLFKLMHERPIPPSSVRDDVDPNLEAICWKAISRRPEDRFATAAEFAEALARFLNGLPWDGSLTRSVSEGFTGPVIPSPVKRPPSLTLRVSEPDRTDVVTPDPSAETIAFQTPSESSSIAPRGKLRIVLASLLLIGALGAVWAIVAHRPKTADKDIVQLPDSRGLPTDGKNAKQTLPKTDAPPAHQADFALEFDGKSSHVAIPTLRRDQVEPVTIEAWVEAIIQGKSNMIVALGGKAYCSLYVRPMNWFANDPTMQSIMQSPMTKGLVHLAFVADDQEGRLFVDGKLVDRSPRTKGPENVEETHAWLGAELERGKLDYFFQGRLHELSVSKIARYDQDFTPTQRFVADQHTLALYHFDEGSGNELKDSSGNGHHGQIVGAKWVQQDEWLPLVNGKDLTGWGRPRGNGNWEVKDGMLVCSAEKGGAGLLKFVGRDFENFQLHAEVRLRGLGNGGLNFDSCVPNACRYQVEISPSNTEASSGSLARSGDWKWLAKKQHSLAPDGEWFDLDILANGPQLDSKVNGQLIGSISDAVPHQVKALTLELDSRLGAVVIEFRKLEIRELVSRPAANGPPPAKAPFDAQQARAHQEEWAKHLGMTVEMVNSVGAKLVLIPPGEFLMGALDDPDAQPQEKPQHKVRLTKPFYIGATEVTVGQFRKFVNATKYVTQAESDGKGAFDVNPKLRKPALVWNGFNHPDEWPVRFVSWEDARRFCEWLSQQERRIYRLPTDAEWEFACRAGTSTRYSFGNGFDHGQANALRDGVSQVRLVAQHPANPFGLFDMHGNVNEICWDGARSYSRENVVDPIGPVDQSRTAVVRGGACTSDPIRLRSSHRYINDSRVFPEQDFATLVKGFRVVAVVEYAQPTNASAGPVLPPPLNPADSGLTIHDPQWKLIEVIQPRGKVFSTRFDRVGRLYFAMPERLDDKSPPPGLYRVQPDGTHQAVVQNSDWEFTFSPDEQRCFAHRGTMGMIAEVDLKSGMSIREIDISPSDDGPTSPHFAPTWYRGSLVNSNEYLLADFGGTKRGPPSTGGIWKFGSDMAAPQRLLTMPEGPARVHALAFGRDELFVAKISGVSGSLATFDGQRLVDRPTEPLPSIGNMVFDPAAGSLLVSEFNGHAVLRIDLAQPDRPASVKPLVSGFRRLNFGVMSLTQDGRRLAVVDFDANTIYVLDRSARDVSAAPVKLDPAAPLPSVTRATGLKLGDLDGDGDLDLFVAMLKAPCVMLRNDGKGNFTDSGQQLGDNASFALALEDLDGDGDRDAFVCNSDDQEDAIWLNDGRGMFQRSPQSFPPRKSNDVALADIEGDKDLDVVVSNWKGSVEIWTNDGAGRFTSQQTIPRINNTGVALGDLDNDGDADLVMTSIGGDNLVWFNDGQGHFADSEQTIEVSESSSVAMGDLDRDGDLDLFITAHQGSQVWFNDGHGRFQASEQRLGDGLCEAVELVDLDADHDLDAVSIGGGFEIAKLRHVWRNDGKGSFQKDVEMLKPGRSQAVTSGDLDGDGDADILFGNLSEPVEVWLNQSNQSTIP